MGLFSSGKTGNPPEDKTKFGRVFNYIIIDSIDDKPMESYPWEFGEKKKGLFAKRVEVVYLQPGHHEIAAHGATYQRDTAVIKVFVEAGDTYVLGAGEDETGNEGLYFELR